MALFRTGDTDYGKLMETKANQYDALITRAEMQHRDSGGKATKKEALYYRDAAKVCEEIRDMNLSQRAEYNKWNGRLDECMAHVESILREINPDFEAMQATSSQIQDSTALASAVPPKLDVDLQPTVSSPKPTVPVASEASKKAADDGNKLNVTNSDKKRGTPVTTPSGFTTYNSCKDVPADVIEGWYKSQPKHDFSNVTGMEDTQDILIEMIDDLGWEKTKKFIDFKEQQCIFFYGLPGTGKTFVIEAFISELMKKGYKYIQLMGGDIHASLVGVAEKTVKIAFQEAIDNAPCVIFIDEFEDVCVNRNSPNAASHEKRLTVAFLEAYNALVESGSQVVLIGATNYPNMVDNAMMDRIFPALVPLPDEKSRVQYFERQFKNITLGNDLSFEYMGERTENCSYRDLGKITSFLKSSLMRSAKKEHSVVDHDGKINKSKSDEAVSEAFKNGDVKLTLETFDSVVGDYKPSDKAANLLSLEEFENRLTKALEGD